MTGTKNLGITLIEQSQAQKEVTVNEALVMLDSIFTGVADKDLATPPVSPADGDLYIVGTSATGDWVTHDDELAHYNQGWRFITPVEGMSVWVLDEDKLYVWNGTAWQISLSEAIGLDELNDVAITTPSTDDLIRYNGTNFVNSKTINQLEQVGINTAADSTNKLSSKSEAVLFASNTNDSRIKVSKNAATDTASHLFQTNFSARAEFGLIGDDDFHLKVSPDNFSTTYETLVVDKDNGETTFKESVIHEKNIKIDGFLCVPAASELTIATGEVTAIKSHHKIDTESDAATDDLDTVNGGTEGDVLILEASHTARTVVIKHATGNIRTFSGADIILDDYGKAAKFFYDGSNWIEF